MKKVLILAFVLVSVTLYSIPKRVTCHARANLGVYDSHGSHFGVGSSVGEAVKAAMLECGSQHIFGCVPVPGCE